jgi:branched-chain amino acid transport system permease protein
MSRRGLIPVGATLAVLVLAVLGPNVLSVTQVLLLAQSFIFAAFALSLFLLLADGGIVSFGHAAFLAGGAYAVAVATTKWEIPIGLAFLLAPVICAVLAAIIGWLSVRLTALYFAMLTLAFGQFVYSIIARVSYFGGESGLTGIPSGVIGIDPDRFYYAGLIVLAVVFAIIYAVRRSPFGLSLRATRENSTRADFAGLSVPHVRLAAVILSGALGGLAGALLAVTNGTVSPDLGFWTQSGTVLVMILIGGMTSMWGPIIGAIALTYGQKYIAEATPEYWQIVLGAALIGLVLFLPGGVTSGVEQLWKRAVALQRRRRPSGAPVAES